MTALESKVEFLSRLVWVLIALLVIVVVVFGILLRNFNTHLARTNANGRELTDWARVTAQWTTHVNDDHLQKSHEESGLAPDHIPPPPDPPPDWDS